MHLPPPVQPEQSYAYANSRPPSLRFESSLSSEYAGSVNQLRGSGTPLIEVIAIASPSNHSATTQQSNPLVSPGQEPFTAKDFVGLVRRMQTEMHGAPAQHHPLPNAVDDRAGDEHSLSSIDIDALMDLDALGRDTEGIGARVKTAAAAPSVANISTIPDPSDTDVNARTSGWLDDLNPNSITSIPHCGHLSGPIPLGDDC
jgi:hypothetical protein